MSFIDWKNRQVELGHLEMARYTNSKAWPYTTAKGYGRRYKLMFDNSLRKLHCRTTMTFDQYLFKVYCSCIQNPDQIGYSKGQYHMKRNGNRGDYSMENAHFELK